MLDKIKEIISENLGVEPEEITLESRLEEDLGADSLDALELAMTVEDLYDIQIDDDELEDLEVVGDILEALERKLG